MPVQRRQIPALLPIAALLTAGASASGCSYRHGKLEQGAEADAALDQKLSFAAVRDQVLVPRCVGCHGEYRDYARVHADRDAIRLTTVVERRMPKDSALAAAELALLTEWLDAGAVERSSAPTPGAPPGPATAPPAPTPPATALEPIPPTWANVQKRFFAPHCVRCHDPDSMDGDLDLTSHEGAKAAASKVLDRVLVRQSMPTSAAAYAKITAEEKLLLVNWISARMPGPLAPGLRDSSEAASRRNR